jgi:uncharacterized protein YneF (UPF0154 family)
MFDPRALVVIVPAIIVFLFVYGVYLSIQKVATDTAEQAEARKSKGHTYILVSIISGSIVGYFMYRYFKKDEKPGNTANPTNPEYQNLEKNKIKNMI